MGGRPQPREARGQLRPLARGQEKGCETRGRGPPAVLASPLPVDRDRCFPKARCSTLLRGAGLSGHTQLNRGTDNSKTTAFLVGPRPTLDTDPQQRLRLPCSRIRCGLPDPWRRAGRRPFAKGASLSSCPLQGTARWHHGFGGPEEHDGSCEDGSPATSARARGDLKQKGRGAEPWGYAGPTDTQGRGGPREGPPGERIGSDRGGEVRVSQTDHAGSGGQSKGGGPARQSQMSGRD